MSTSITQTTTNSGSGLAASGSVTDVGTTFVNTNYALAAGSSNVALGTTFNGANLQNLLIVSTQNCTLKINSTGSPFATINLVAGAPYAWSASAAYTANPLNVNVTNIYATCTPSCVVTVQALTT